MSLLVFIVCSASADFGTITGDGYSYLGGLENGKPSGLGIRVFTCGAISLGIYDPTHGYIYGFAVTVDPQGDTFYPNLYAGFLANSKSLKIMDKFNYKDINGKIIYYSLTQQRGEDKRIFGKITYASGTVYYGETVDGNPSGYGIYIYENGEYFGGLTVNGQLNGWGILMEADGTGFMGTFVAGVLHGYAYYFDENGDAYLCEYDMNRWVQTLNDCQPLTRAQTSLPPETLVANLGTEGLTVYSSSLTLDTESTSKHTRCSRCGGTGEIICTHCGGKGYYYTTYHVNDDGTRVRERLNCPYCNGGYITCWKCNGTGEE